MNYPNFNVIHEEINSKTMTVVFNAQVPKDFQGTLLQLTTDELTTLELVLTNLNIERVFMYSVDANLLHELKNSGFGIELI